VKLGQEDLVWCIEPTVNQEAAHELPDEIQDLDLILNIFWVIDKLIAASAPDI
jgi:hypothetical protein